MNFKIFTDQKPLITFMEKSQREQIGKRWQAMLSEHDCKIVHIEGMKNRLADYLSRRYKYCPDPPLGSDFIPSSTDPFTTIITSHTHILPPANLPILHTYQTSTINKMTSLQLLTCNYQGCEARLLQDGHHQDCPFRDIQYNDTWDSISGGLINEDEYADDEMECCAPYSPTSPPPRTPTPYS